MGTAKPVWPLGFTFAAGSRTGAAGPLAAAVLIGDPWCFEALQGGAVLA
jgi:hypothetical protein